MNRILIALAALMLVGCAKGTETTTTAASAAPAKVAPAGAPESTALAGDSVHGKAIFAQNCAACHGAGGAKGGVGPSLLGEKKTKDLHAAIAWIKNPQAPMPKLYPSPLGEKDVADVAAYVESL